ncbi:hypothetical protein LB505_004906 [Fusarium chuoi]|nr:hypothetical protein LB505_004906 [Fusarium chuoi]
MWSEPFRGRVGEALPQFCGWHPSGQLCLYGGDAEDHRRHRRRGLERYGNTYDELYGVQTGQNKRPKWCSTNRQAILGVVSKVHRVLSGLYQGQPTFPHVTQLFPRPAVEFQTEGSSGW